MRKDAKVFLCTIAIFVLGYFSGYINNYDTDNSPSLTELRIERTQLEIKILKGECNNATKTTTTEL